MIHDKCHDFEIEPGHGKERFEVLFKLVSFFQGNTRSLALAGLLFVSALQKARAESLVVQANNPNKTYSSGILDLGKTYEISVSGKVYWDHYSHYENGVFEPGNWSDAEWFGCNWLLWPGNPYEHVGNDPLFDGFDLVIDDTFVDWYGNDGSGQWSQHAYSTDHIYKYWIVGQGQTVSFRYAEPYEYPTCYQGDWYEHGNWHGDNSGSFNVSISEAGEPSVPGPAAVLPMALGLAAGYLKRRKHR